MGWVEARLFDMNGLPILTNKMFFSSTRMCLNIISITKICLTSFRASLWLTRLLSISFSSICVHTFTSFILQILYPIYTTWNDSRKLYAESSPSTHKSLPSHLSSTAYVFKNKLAARRAPSCIIFGLLTSFASSSLSFFSSVECFHEEQKILTFKNQWESVEQKEKIKKSHSRKFYILKLVSLYNSPFYHIKETFQHKLSLGFLIFHLKRK